MLDFVKEYKVYDRLNINDRKKAVVLCAKCFETETLDFIIKNLSKLKQKQFSKEPIEIIFVDKANKNIVFGNNVVTILEDYLYNDKKEIFFKVAQNTICAIFVNLFYNTASDPNKKTKFSDIANGYLATITTENAKDSDFEHDMMAQMQEFMVEIMDAGFEQ